jgi:hypothetical protein
MSTNLISNSHLITNPLHIKTIDGQETSHVESKKAYYSSNFLNGLVYVTNGLTNIVQLTATAVASVFPVVQKSADALLDASDVINDSIEPITEIPESVGLRRYFSVFTGISCIIEGKHMIHHAHESHHKWGMIDGISKIARGVFEASSGFIQGTTKALMAFAEEAVNTDHIKTANIAGDILTSLQFIMMAFSSLHNARLAGNLKREITVQTEPSALSLKIKSLFFRTAKETLYSKIPQVDLSQRRIQVIKQIMSEKTNHSKKAQLHNLLGEKLFKKLEALTQHFDKEGNQISSLELDDTLVDEVIKKLGKYEFSNAVLGTCCVLASIVTIVADFLSHGLASEILNILKPVFAIVFFYYDLNQFKEGVQSSENVSKFNKIMRYTLAAICIAIAIGTFVGGSVSTCGALPIAMLVIGIVMPLISLYISQNRAKVAACFNYCSQSIKALFAKRQDLNLKKKIIKIQDFEPKNIPVDLVFGRDFNIENPIRKKISQRQIKVA